MIKRLVLRNFKAFESLTVTFGSGALIVGPNNAGKSTVIAAIRTCSEMVHYAANKPPTGRVHDGATAVFAYHFGPSQFSLIEENIRHEFRQEIETRAELSFANGAALTAVWPAIGADVDADADTPSPFFYLTVQDRPQPRTPKDVRAAFPTIGIVPMLSPVEHDEAVLDERYVRRNLDGRLASRHFRNQLYLLQQEYGTTHPTRLEDFLDWAGEWIPEVTLNELQTRMGRDGQELDLFYTEPGRRATKEIFWAGDGIQVWVQLLLHTFRLQNASSVVFDEPDLYLHADLQRRLIQLLENLPAQAITATHSPEMLVEAAPESVIWVEKSRRRAVRGPDAALLAEIADAIGSHFNLRLARALRSKVVLFVEGKDMKILRTLARTVGAKNLSREIGVAVIPLEGFSNWEHIEPFAWLVEKLLERSVISFVVLDRDYRPQEAVRAVEDKLSSLGIRPHVWARKELESYLLEPRVMSRATKASESWMSEALQSAAESMRPQVFARCLDEAQRAGVSPTHHRVSVTEQFQPVFDKAWADIEQRPYKCPAKDLLRALNRRLADEKLGQLTARQLAQRLRPHEIAPEMREMLLSVEAALEE